VITGFIQSKEREHQHPQQDQQVYWSASSVFFFSALDLPHKTTQVIIAWRLSFGGMVFPLVRAFVNFPPAPRIK